MNMSFSMLSWNVRGLNNPARRSSVRLFLQTYDVSLVCLQESKLELVDVVVVNQTLGRPLMGSNLSLLRGPEGVFLWLGSKTA
ncbi:hypothetical protein CFC21_083396 [Triticum aestivum]|uniref:Endonuclease/exonuclease/phosphatase domain-containing protein n=2 Tax=Triticum aestivum TaxID=4565 RepID=A0A9R1L639_WHEAT|nr:hypothetical protein CFC21_083396 [Triticum aestivum]